jgi:hypothetical protein
LLGLPSILKESNQIRSRIVACGHCSFGQSDNTLAPLDCPAHNKVRFVQFIDQPKFKSLLRR